MRYSYEYKRKCIELYREGRWPETPTGIKEPGNFHCMIRRWVREEEANGPEKEANGPERRKMRLNLSVK